MAHQEHRLTEQQHQQRDLLRQEHPTLQALYELMQWFSRMIRLRCGEKFDQWLQAVETSAIPELHRFAKGLIRDKASVQAALTSALSNGMVEGFVNKLKTLKRRMFGRASPNLLRQRLLYAP
jgi:transposase